MNINDTISTTPEEPSELKFNIRHVAVLAVAHGQEGATSVDRIRIKNSLVIGRGDRNDLAIVDPKMSKKHCEISLLGNEYRLTDLDSTNGTFVNGKRLYGSTVLADSDLIRTGRTLLVFHDRSVGLLEPPSFQPGQPAGRFQTRASINELKEAALSKRHLLLAGPTGTGKELAAKSFSDFLGRKLIAYNAARHSSDEEAMSTLFGVAPKVFSNVAARPGLIEQADGGVLFLDEVHNLSERVQRGLLRIMEDGSLSRLGDTTSSSMCRPNKRYLPFA